MKLTRVGCDSDEEEQGETTPHQTPERISNQLYGKYKEIKVGYSSELLKSVLGYAVPQCVLGDDPVVPVLPQDVGLRAWQGGSRWPP